MRPAAWGTLARGEGAYWSQMLFVFDKVEQSWLCDLRLLAECLELNGRPLPTPLLWDPQVRRGVVRPDAADSVMSESLMAPKVEDLLQSFLHDRVPKMWFLPPLRGSSLST